MKKKFWHFLHYFIKPTSSFIWVILGALALQGCIMGSSYFVGSALVATTSFVHTDTLPTDSIAESVTGFDCSYVRYLKDGGDFCRNPNKENIKEPIFCYKHLSGVQCYKEKQPNLASIEIIAQ